jgi:hypothetical protein
MTLYRRIFAVLAWITLGVQYGLFLKALTVAAILERTVEYVSYFTIVTNFLIAFAFTVPVLAPGSRAGRWWAAASPRRSKRCSRRRRAVMRPIATGPWGR